jgi:hypothetical protein
MNLRGISALGSVLLLCIFLVGAIDPSSAEINANAPPTPLPPVQNSDGRFGIDFVTGVGYNSSETRLQQAEDAGANFTRWPIYWYDIEASSGQPNYSQVDIAVDASMNHGLKVDAILMGTPHWASTSGSPDVPFPKIGGSLAIDGQQPGVLSGAPEASPPQNLYAPVFNGDGSINQNNYWARFVYNTVLRYKGRVRVWEMWNEPDLTDTNGQGIFWAGTRADYYRLLKVGYLAAKKADPTVTVLFAGLAYWTDRDYFPAVLDLIQNDASAAQNGYYFDVLPWHLYVSPYHLWSFPRWSRDEMKLRGFTKPIWVNEANIPVCGDSAVDPGFDCPKRWRGSLGEQANFVIQAYALAAAARVRKVFIFQHYDDNIGLHDWYGLIRNDGSIRPAYVAYQAAAYYLSSPGGVSRSTTGNIEKVVFKDTPKGRVTVLWNRGPNALTAKVAARSNNAVLATKYGVETTISPQNGYYSVQLPGATYRDPVTDSYDVGGDPYFLVESVFSDVSSQVDTLPEFAGAKQFRVRWRRTDQGQGTRRYDIQYRDGNSGSWVTWLSNTASTSAWFGPTSPITVTEGHTYYFRSRARDGQDNLEPYPAGDGDARTTVPYFIRGQVTDHTGLPVVGARVVARSIPFSVTTNTGGFYRLGVYPIGDYRVQARKSGFGWLPAKLIGVSGGIKYSFFLPPKENAVVNGGFENGFNAWTHGEGIFRKTFRHTGDWGVYLTTPGRLSQVVLPTNQSDDTVLSLVYRVPPSSTAGKLKILVQGKDVIRRQTVSFSPDDVWRHHYLRIPAHRGPLKLSFWVTGDAPVLWLDEISLGPPQAKFGEHGE